MQQFIQKIESIFQVRTKSRIFLLEFVMAAINKMKLLNLENLEKVFKLFDKVA